MLGFVMWRFPFASQVPFKQQNFSTAMNNTGLYEAACNLFWLDLRYSPCSKVPIRPKAVMEMRDQYFKEPTRHYPWTVQIALDDIPDDFSKPFGSLKRVSPQEMEDALFLRIEEAIDAGADEKEMEIWRACLTSATFHFEVMPSEDGHHAKAASLSVMPLAINQLVV